MVLDQNLFEKNLEAFRLYHPKVYRQLKAIEAPTGKLIGSIEAGDLNLDLGHTSLYATDAVSHAKTQIEEFRRVPPRFYMDPPARYREPKQQHHYFSKALYDHFEGCEISEVPFQPSNDGGYILVYGIGLGLHVRDLLAETDAVHFILMEEFVEFLYHALYLSDWTTLFERAETKGQSIRFIFGHEPSSVADECHWHMRGEGFGLIDGSYIFRHYSSTMLDEAHAQFRKNLPLLPVSIGFFEDELIMLRNCGTNLMNRAHYLLDGRPRLRKDVPIVIAGSGPSFDESVEVLRGIRDKVILFSCGTGLSNLLKHGIRPDFHCELENVFGSYEHLRRVKEAYGPLDDITLIASNTVHPLTPELFKRNIFYFRDAVSSTPQWCPDKYGIYGTAPTVTNLGIRAALLLCFREIYLFGVDLGTRDQSRHHSNAAIYATDQEWSKKYLGNAKMTIPMPANFGGQAYTSEVLQWAQMLMVQSISAFSLAKIYNCSDGVKIAGTLPRLPHTVKLETPPGRCRVVIDRMMGELDEKAAGEMIDLADLAETKQDFREWADDLTALADRAIETDMSFLEFYKGALPFLALDSHWKHQMTMRAVYIGSLMMGFQMTYFFYRRVPEAKQSSLMSVFLTELKNRIAFMGGEVDRELSALEILGTKQHAA